MKHKTLLLSFFVFAALVTTSVARAEDSTSTDDKPWKERMEERREMMIENKTERQEMMQENATERRELFKENSEERREGMKVRFDEFKKQRIGGMIEMMTKRFEWAIARLENIADRIEARIEKIEDETDTTLTDARTYLDEARTDIADATKLLSEIDVDIDSITADETKTDERFSGFRDAFGAVKTEIKSAWTHLGEAVQAIKGERSDDAKKEPMDDWNTNN
ncbi:MAG: hypothetical protein QG633_178 [Patescibacteria group bacterium]|jgi:DNA anti-recombination protein RmuC|nr:hypothetical protein [Patescibacteria group bacterium]